VWQLSWVCQIRSSVLERHRTRTLVVAYARGYPGAKSRNATDRLRGEWAALTQVKVCASDSEPVRARQTSRVIADAARSNGTKESFNGDDAVVCQKEPRHERSMMKDSAFAMGMLLWSDPKSRGSRIDIARQFESTAVVSKNTDMRPRSACDRHKKRSALIKLFAPAGGYQPHSHGHCRWLAFAFSQLTSPRGHRRPLINYSPQTQMSL